MPARVDQLTAAIASGDTEAFGRFYESYFDMMYREARRATRLDEAFCLDVVQDACLRVIRSLSPMETEAQLAAWLRRVVRSCAIDRLRSEARRREREREAARRAAARPAAGGDAGSSTEDREKLDWLRARLAELDGEQSQMLIERFKLDRTLDLIGRAIGLAPGAVDGRIRRVLETMRRREREPCQEQYHDA